MTTEFILILLQMFLAFTIGLLIGLVLAIIFYSKLLNVNAWKTLLTRQRPQSSVD